LGLAEAKHVRLYVSSEILEEVNRSLDRPSLRRRVSKITDERVEKFLERVGNVGTLLPNPSPVFSLKRDPKDEPYLNLAIAAGASFVVSRDKDLLDLMKDDQFRQTYPDITIIDPVAFLAHVRGELADQLGHE
jgi:putative PIN family toxin of toxin-antitoxin system